MSDAVDAGRWGRVVAEVVLAEALAARGVSGVPVALWDAGTFVFHVGDVVGKVYGPGAPVDRCERAAAAGVRLAGAGVPVLAPLHGGELFRGAGGAVGFWPFVEAVRSPTWRDLGALLRACHEVSAGVLERVDLPVWDPLVATRWATGPYRCRRDADAGLADAIDATGVVLSERAAAVPVAGAALVHGDAQLQNVIVGVGGACLIDLDWLAVGPPVVDTAPVVFARRRGVLDDVGYGEFVAAYGADPVSLPGTEVLAAACELGEAMFRLALACRRGEPVGWLRDAVGPLLI